MSKHPVNPVHPVKNSIRNFRRSEGKGTNAPKGFSGTPDAQLEHTYAYA